MARGEEEDPEAAGNAKVPAIEAGAASKNMLGSNNDYFYNNDSGAQPGADDEFWYGNDKEGAGNEGIPLANNEYQSYINNDANKEGAILGKPGSKK